MGGIYRMKLNRMTPCQNIEIWSPRWKDRKVMIAKYKVGTHNKITFSGMPNKSGQRTGIPSLPGEYYISGAKAATYPQQGNGKLMCYCVPLDELEPLEYE